MPNLSILFSRYYLLLLVFLLILSFFLLSYKITEVPAGINGDEAAIGYNSALIALTGKDESHKHLPLFVSTFNGEDWKQPITIYATVLGFVFFSPSYEILRGISIFFALISSALLFYLVKEILDLKTAFLAIILFITTPIILIQSHLALENIAPIPFVLGWLIMLFKYQKTKSLKFLTLSLLVIEASFYSYLGMRLMAPVLILLTVGYALFLNLNQGLKILKYPKKIWSLITVIIISLLPFLGTLLLVKIYYPGAFFARNRPLVAQSYQDFILPYISSYDLSFLFLKGDSSGYHSTGKQGLFLISTMPLFFIGIYQAIRSKNSFLILVLCAFFLSPLLFGFVNSIYRASRLLTFVPLYIIISVFGLYFLTKIKNRILKRIIYFLFILLFLFNLFDFLKDYWFQYPSRSRLYFPSGAYQGYKNLKYQSGLRNLQPFVEIGVYNQESTASKFFEIAYFANGLSQWSLTDKLPQKSLILIHSSDVSKLEQKGAKEIKVDMPYYSLMYVN